MLVKRKKLMVELVCFWGDILSIFISYIFAMYVRYEILESDPGIKTLSAPYLLFAFLYSILLSNLLHMMRTENKKYFIDYNNSFYNIVAINGIGCLLILAFFYISNMPYFSRWALILFWIFSCIVLFAKNSIFNFFVRKCNMYEKMIKVLVVGGGNLAKEYCFANLSCHSSNFKIVGYIDDENSKELILEDLPYWGNENDNIKCLGKFDDINDLIISKKIDEIVIALENIEPQKVGELVEYANSKGVGVTMLSKYSRYIPYKPLVRDIYGVMSPIRTIEMRKEIDKKNTSLMSIILTICISMLLIMLVINLYMPGEFNKFYYYESYKAILFAIIGFFAYWKIQINSKMQIRKCLVLVLALMLIIIAMYEMIYSGWKIESKIIFKQELLYTGITVIGCAIINKLIDFIGKDDFGLLL